MQSFADDLSEYLAERAGMSLRCVVRFTPQELDVVYARDDLDEAAVERRSEEIHNNVTAGPGSPESALQSALGDVDATLQLRQEAVILHLPRDDGPGAIVSLEPEAASQLELFVGECLRLM